MFSFGKSDQKPGFNPKNSENEVIIIIKKGESKKINVDILEDIIIKLARHPTVKIDSLNGKLKKNHQTLVTYVELLHGNEHYPILIDLINKHFSKFKNPIPGTIAGYAYGCNTKTQGVDTECSSLCAGSIKTSNDSAFCDLPIIYATYEDGQFTFNNVDGIQSAHNCIIHVGYSSLRLFPGFNDREKNYLRRYDYQKIYLYGFLGNGKYVNLYKGRPECDSDNAVIIDNIKSRVGTVENDDVIKNGFNNFDFGSSLAFVFLVIIILLVFFFVYKYSTYQKSE